MHWDEGTREGLHRRAVQVRWRVARASLPPDRHVRVPQEVTRGAAEAGRIHSVRLLPKPLLEADLIGRGVCAHAPVDGIARRSRARQWVVRARPSM